MVVASSPYETWRTKLLSSTPWAAAASTTAGSGAAPAGTNTGAQTSAASGSATEKW